MDGGDASARQSARPWRDGVFLALGSNMGDRSALLRQAVAALAAHDDIRVEAIAAFRDTTPVGPVAQPRYLNTVCRVTTRLPSEALLLVCQSIERLAGRDRLREPLRWGPRPLDIDLIFYGAEVSETPVVYIPHPEYRYREFVLEPLLELAPDWVDPQTGVPLRTYWERLWMPTGETD